MTFKSTRTSVLLIISLIALLHVFFGSSLVWLVLPAVVFLLLIAYGSITIQANFFTPALCCADIVDKYIALSFDDGPNQQYTPEVLSTLAQYNAPATFFVIGKNILGNESILQQIDVAGHSIGNHSYSHSFFIDFKSVQGFKHELQQTEDSVFNVIGKRMTLFRPPYGVTTPHLAQAAKALNYTIVGWNIRSFDTTTKSAQAIAQRVQSQIKPGAIILFHDTSVKTIQALKQTLDFAKHNGYKVISIEQLLKINVYG
ncbi:polysaccharide deacetylase family protein [Crenothrix sp.]|uniref:polysaccharide deacetylase family protein n=1 Tax=Crenothrix sp. TaxID=3100433 RepID=UPI00374D63D8